MQILANTAAERRISLILMQYWNELRGDRDFPHEDEIDPDRLAEIWGKCFLIQLRDIEKVPDFNYTYFGDDLRQAYDSGILDPLSELMIGPDATLMAHHFTQVFETREPVMYEDRYENSTGQMILFRQAFMPLGRGETIESILGGAWYRFA